MIIILYFKVAKIAKFVAKYAKMFVQILLQFVQLQKQPLYKCNQLIAFVQSYLISYNFAKSAKIALVLTNFANKFANFVGPAISNYEEK